MRKYTTGRLQTTLSLEELASAIDQSTVTDLRAMLDLKSDPPGLLVTYNKHKMAITENSKANTPYKFVFWTDTYSPCSGHVVDIVDRIVKIRGGQVVMP